MKEVLIAIFFGTAAFLAIKVGGELLTRWSDRRRLARLRKQVDAAHEAACRRSETIHRQRTALNTVNGKANL